MAALAEVTIIAAMGIVNEDMSTASLALNKLGFPAIVANVVASIVVVMIVSGG